MNKKLLFVGAASVMLVGTSAMAQDAGAVPADSVFIFNTLLFLIGGFLVMWMAAGFAMLEAGLVRSKNVTTQLTKNIGLFSIAALVFWLIGYNLMYPGNWGTSLEEGEKSLWLVDGWLGNLFSAKDIKPMIEVDGKMVSAVKAADGYSPGSDFFFQLMFCAATASIVSGTLAERIKLWPFFIFTVFLTGVIYPIEASWQWGAGHLAAAGFSDFAGSTLVHAAGGWAALAGAIVLGARAGKYKNGRVNPMPGSNLPLATLGTFILWMGWFGFNGGSQLAMGSVTDADAVAMIFANTNTAAAAGAVVAMVLTQIMYGKIDLTMVLNGALAGLVAITAEPLAPTLGASALIGAVGGLIVVIFVPILDKLKIDDVVGAIPVHLIAGIWGTIAVAFNTRTEYKNEAGEAVARSFMEQLMVQLYGIALIGAFVFVASIIVWMILKAVMGLRVDEEAEINGLDTTELGMEAYPEFGKGSQTI